MSTSTVAVLLAADVAAIAAVVGYLLRGRRAGAREPVVHEVIRQTTAVEPARNVVPEPRRTADGARALGRLYAR